MGDTDRDALADLIRGAWTDEDEYDPEIIAAALIANRAAVLRALGATWERRYLPSPASTARVPKVRWITRWEDVTDERG